METDSIIIDGSADRPILIDVSFNRNNLAKPVIIFCHGFKGFKDWGAFPLMAKYFAEASFVCVKFNFSYNGGTAEEHIDFPDLEAFGRNNYSIELDDLGMVIDALEKGQLIDRDEIDFRKLYLIGHSRGGGIAVLKAAEDTRIAKLITLAGVSDFANRFPEGDQLAEWKKLNVMYIPNGRTHQQMPMQFQFYENFILNKNRLDIPSAAKRLSIPYLIIHGGDDETVRFIEAENLHRCARTSSLIKIPKTGHTFGMKQPWESLQMPEDFKKAIDSCVEFLTA